MNFQEAEKTYRDLKAQHAAGKLSDVDFEAEVAKLRHQDAQGRWWQLGVQTGEWYMHDGQKWNKARPPAISAAPAAEPSAAPEGGAAQKPRLASVLPARLFSAAPAGRGAGGLPPAALIVIVAIVALIAVAALVGGYLVISGALGGSSTARGTTTPTRSLALLPTPVIPTITLARPTDIPLPPPTIEVTTTEATPTHTPGPARPTATKKPAVPPTPAGPTATATLNIPPGVYVTKLEADPKPNTDPTNLTGFKMTVFNSTGGTQTFRKWFVRIFQCPVQCSGDNAFKVAYGESLKFDANVAPGTVVLTTPPHAHFGPGPCDYTAIPYYTDANEIAAQFQKPGGGGLYYSFNICQ